MKPSRCARVLVIDEEVIDRIGLLQFIGALPGYRVCHATGTAAAAEVASLQSPPDLIVFRLPTPAVEALGELRRLLRAVSRAPCVTLAAHGDLACAEWVFRAGALGVIDKSEAHEHLAPALASAQTGQPYTSPNVTKAILTHLAHPAADAKQGDGAQLSARELEIFTHRAQGRGPKAIAERLGISRKTIESHEAKMKTKLRLRTTAELVRRAEKWLAEQAMGR